MCTILVLTLGRARPYSQKPGPTPNPPSHPHFWIAVTRSPLLGQAAGAEVEKNRLHRTRPHTRVPSIDDSCCGRAWEANSCANATGRRRSQDKQGQQNCRTLPGKEAQPPPSFPSRSPDPPRGRTWDLPPSPSASRRPRSFHAHLLETWTSASPTPLSQPVVPPFSPHASLPLGAEPDPAVLIGQIAGGVGRSCERYSAFRSGSFNIGAGLTEGLNS